jgi:hypothetical protein
MLLQRNRIPGVNATKKLVNYALFAYRCPVIMVNDQFENDYCLIRQARTTKSAGRCLKIKSLALERFLILVLQNGRCNTTK